MNTLAGKSGKQSQRKSYFDRFWGCKMQKNDEFCKLSQQSNPSDKFETSPSNLISSANEKK